MKQRFVIFSLFLIFAITAQAQYNMSDINRIKRDKNYLYGEATLNNKEAALKLAYELLEVEIKNWALQKSTDISSVLASGINDFADTIILPRGNMIRAFAFVKISNLKTSKGKNLAVKIDNAEPVKEEPAPVKEDSISVKEETAPVKEESTPVKEETAPVKEESAPAKEESTPVKEESAPVKEESTPVKEESAPDKEVSAPVIEEPKVKTIEDEVLEKILQVRSFYDLEKTMKPLKEEGKIVDFGKYTTMSDPANSYLIIYDQEANIKAVLGKGTDSRKNLKTGANDSEKNYRGCGAIWYKVK